MKLTEDEIQYMINNGTWGNYTIRNKILENQRLRELVEEALETISLSVRDVEFRSSLQSLLDKAKGEKE